MIDVIDLLGNWRIVKSERKNNSVNSYDIFSAVLSFDKDGCYVIDFPNREKAGRLKFSYTYTNGVLRLVPDKSDSSHGFNVILKKQDARTVSMLGPDGLTDWIQKQSG